MSERLPVLRSNEGELVSVRITVEPRFLEDLLEVLAEVDFPINPQIYHSRPTVVEFPAYQSRLKALQAVLHRAGFPAGTVKVCPMAEELFVHV